VTINGATLCRVGQLLSMQSSIRSFPLTLVSFFFFVHFRGPAPPFLPPVSRSGFVFFRPRSCSPSFFLILFHFCSQLFVFLRSWFSRMVCSFSLFSSLLPFRLRFTVFHCRDHLFGWYSPPSGTFLSRRIAISVNFS